MDKETLLPPLRELAQRPCTDSLAGLDERKVKELEFHNKDGDKAMNSRLPKDTFELHGRAG